MQQQLDSVTDGVTVDGGGQLFRRGHRQAIHGDDLKELKAQAVKQRKAFQDYCNAVSSMSPDEAVLTVGKKYVETVQAICELILDSSASETTSDSGPAPRAVVGWIRHDRQSIRAHPGGRVVGVVGFEPTTRIPQRSGTKRAAFNFLESWLLEFLHSLPGRDKRGIRLQRAPAWR